MGEIGPHAPSIFERFSLLPWLASVASSVAPDGCPGVLEAAREARAGRGEDAQSDNKHATILDGQAGGSLLGSRPGTSRKG
jgi:hypothetical protein